MNPLSRRQFLATTTAAAASLGTVGVTGCSRAATARAGGGFPEGFGVFDCLPDGTFSFAYQPSDWKAAGA